MCDIESQKKAGGKFFRQLHHLLHPRHLFLRLSLLQRIKNLLKLPLRHRMIRTLRHIHNLLKLPGIHTPTPFRRTIKRSLPVISTAIRTRAGCLHSRHFSHHAGILHISSQYFHHANQRIDFSIQLIAFMLKLIEDPIALVARLHLSASGFL